MIRSTPMGGDTLYVMDQISDKKNKRRKLGGKAL